MTLSLFTRFAIAGSALLLFSCNNQQQDAETVKETAVPQTPIINYAVKAIRPHDPTLFTEGLLIHKGQMFESTGSPEDIPAARSLIGIVDTATGKLNIKVELNREKYFGEGIAVLGTQLYQLTYQTNVGFVYNISDFKQTNTFNFTNKEGWGLTTDGKHLIMSDGTSTLTFLDPSNFSVVKTLQVTENSNPVEKLNELEYINGYIYANVWTTNYIVKINSSTGVVEGKIDCSSLVLEAKNKNPEADVLNGIAYDADTDKIFVTGKLWTHIYQIEFVH